MAPTTEILYDFIGQSRCRASAVLSAAMSNRIAVGAVAYDPKVVTIWEMINDFFRARGVPNDYVLFSNYEAQVEAFIQGQYRYRAGIRIWRYVACIAGLADVAGCWPCATRTWLLQRLSWQERIRELTQFPTLKANALRSGSRDSGQAAILPAYFLRMNGTDPEKDLRLTRFDLDVGKHGDTGTSEVAVLESIVKGTNGCRRRRRPILG